MPPPKRRFLSAAVASKCARDSDFFLKFEFPFNVRVQRELFTDNARDFDPDFERTSSID
jgi:hypothetical protein